MSKEIKKAPPSSSPLNSLEREIRLSRLIFDEALEYELDESCPWLWELYNELEEETDREDPQYKRGDMRMSLRLERKSSPFLGNHLLVKGSLESHYTAACIRCLTPTPEHISITFQCCFVDSHLEETPEYEELDDVFTENEQWGLYFYKKNNINIAEMVHEQLYMHVNPFPLHDENCLGLCHECGADLNKESCEHHPRKIS